MVVEGWEKNIYFINNASHKPQHFIPFHAALINSRITPRSEKHQSSLLYLLYSPLAPQSILHAA